MKAVPLQEGMVPYNISLVVKGDITVAVWFGMYNMGLRLTTQPALAFCFHTSFMDSGIERVGVPQLDIADPSLFTEDTVQTFFLDMQLTDWDEPEADQDDAEEIDLSCDVLHWRNKWQETVDKRYRQKGLQVSCSMHLSAICQSKCTFIFHPSLLAMTFNSKQWPSYT